MKPIQVLKATAHVAALIFGAFWLVATTSTEARVAPRDCFTGVSNPATLRVVLGTIAAPTDGGFAPASCQGLDGIGPGSTIEFDLSQGARPASGTGCFGYKTDAISGVVDVTLGPAERGGGDFSLTVADGEFSSAQLQGCRGAWSISLAPATEPRSGQSVSPLNASDTNRWRVGRVIDVDHAESCGAPFTQTGQVRCQDDFEVVSITQVAP